MKLAIGIALMSEVGMNLIENRFVQMLLQPLIRFGTSDGVHGRQLSLE